MLANERVGRAIQENSAPNPFKVSHEAKYVVTMQISCAPEIYLEKSEQGYTEAV